MGLGRPWGEGASKTMPVPRSGCAPRPPAEVVTWNDRMARPWPPSVAHAARRAGISPGVVAPHSRVIHHMRRQLRNPCARRLGRGWSAWRKRYPARLSRQRYAILPAGAGTMVARDFPALLHLSAPRSVLVELVGLLPPPPPLSSFLLLLLISPPTPSFSSSSFLFFPFFWRRVIDNQAQC